MPIDWKSVESYQRLLGAMCAAADNNIDFKKVAYYFGQGATYDSIEGRFRIAKKLAKELAREAEEEGREMPTTRTKSANSTPRKPKAKPTIDTTNGVKSGRITKSPSKKKSSAVAQRVKQEPQTPSSMEDAYNDEEYNFSAAISGVNLNSQSFHSFTTDGGDWMHNVDV